MNLAQLTHFLQTHFHPTAHNLRPIGAGMFSQAYRFEADKEAFVLRIGVTREAFEKDQFAAQQLDHAVPIPNVLAIGAYNVSHFYCITDWCAGQVLTAFDKAATERLLPSVFDRLWAMAQVSVSPDIGFGILNGVGESRKRYGTWADFISAIDDFAATFTARGDEVYKPWEELYQTTFLDKALVQDAYYWLVRLLPYLANERHYVHGDFGHENALAENNRLMAILDWAELRCGDWLYDLAYMAYYDTLSVDYIGLFRQWADRKGLAIPNFTERVQACYLNIFLGNVFLEANRNQRDWYNEDVERYRQKIELYRRTDRLL